MLPPVVRLSFIPKCKRRPARAAVLSELNTFLNLIEAHMGKPALIRVSRDFDAAYNIGEGINRTLWLERNFLQPDYASRPWVMWTASNNHLTKGIEQPVEWDVVRSEEHTSELQSLMRISYAVFCLKKKKQQPYITMKTHVKNQHKA